MSVRSPVVCALFALVPLLGGCREQSATATDDDATVVITGLDHTLMGAGGRRGGVRADSARFGDQLGTVRLLRPVLNVFPSERREQPIEIAADSGTLDVATGIVRLYAPTRSAGAPASLANRTMIGYDPVGDTIWGN